MRTSFLVAVLILGALSEACTGGELTDPNGSPITGTNAKYSVVFTNTSSGASYSARVDTNGYFSFDPSVAASSENTHVIIPQGSYAVTVAQAGNTYFTPFNVQHTYNNTSCSDHWGAGTEQCALYQLRLLNQAGTPPVPYATSALGYNYTVIPLEPLHGPGDIWVSVANRAVVLAGDGFTPNSAVFFKVVGAQSGALYHDQTLTSSSAGGLAATTWQMCLQGADTSATVIAQDQVTGLWSNAWPITPSHC